MIEVYKIIHGKYDKTCSLELELYQSVHATRANSLKLTNTRCHYDLRKYFLAAELSIYGIVCHLKLLMRHLLIHSKTDYQNWQQKYCIMITLTLEVLTSLKVFYV